MRLGRLDLIRYGKFTDHHIDFGTARPGEPDFHIIYGLNEAGKSTSFCAYLDLLFGIPERSGYNFLHAYPTMRIGARLEIDGRSHHLARLKQRSGSLVDGDGQPVSEALIASALGGIGREAYRSMFSLDEESLKDGGNAILQSRGDLGEMLFSASSGLSGLSRALVQAGEEADRLYRKRASTTQLADLKKSLEALKAERAAIDTQASAHAALTAALAKAEAEYDGARAALADHTARHQEVTRLLAALPLMAERDRLADHPLLAEPRRRPPAEWFAQLPALTDADIRLTTLGDRLDRTIAEQQADLEAMDIDAAGLALAAHRHRLDQGRSRSLAALDDLPKRRQALALQQDRLAALLVRLGRSGTEDPDRMVLPAAVIGRLRGLIESRSGIETALAVARRERQRSADALARLTAEDEAEAPDVALAAPEALAQVDAALARLAGSDGAARLRLADRLCRDRSEALHQALDRLRPWTGDAQALKDLPRTEPRLIERWRGELAGWDRQRSEQQGRLRELETEQARLAAQIAAMADQGTVDDRAAEAVRAARDRAWRSHRATLTEASAGEFETRLREDDRVTAARLARAADLSALRQARQSLAMVGAAIARHRLLLAEAEAGGQALAAQIGSLLPEVLLPESGGAPPDAGARLIRLDRVQADREAALAALEALASAEADRDELQRALDADSAALAAALEAAGHDRAGELSLADRLEAARQVATRASASQAARQSRARALAEQTAAAEDRARDLALAEAAEARWQADWQDALAPTWLAAHAGLVPQGQPPRRDEVPAPDTFPPEDSLPSEDRLPARAPESGMAPVDPVSLAQSVATVRDMLALVADLPALCQERREMAQRVAAMERDEAQFRDDLLAILTETGLEDADMADSVMVDPIGLADRLLARHAEAVNRRRLRDDRAAALERLRAERRTLEEERALHQARKGEMTAYFGQDTLAGVAEQLEAIRERDRIEDRLAALTEQLLKGLQVADLTTARDRLAACDGPSLEREAADQGARIEDLSERSRQLYAERTRAEDRLAAVGGDDAVARIEARRRTVLLEIEDVAERYLLLRTGALAAEQALHLYRDRHRSAMLKRASEAFRIITDGAYAGLATQPDKEREILIALARDGGSKLADTLSTGTRFQLYLALRLAGYEEFAALRPAVPFIADDIMETFDDPRSEAVLRLLGALSRIGQVIYLTHHSHLCTMAEAIVPGVRLHRLPGPDRA